jgi:hypothetical protein
MTESIDDIATQAKGFGIFNLGGFVFGMVGGYVMGKVAQPELRQVSPYYFAALFSGGINVAGFFGTIGSPIFLGMTPGMYAGSALGYHLSYVLR